MEKLTTEDVLKKLPITLQMVSIKPKQPSSTISIFKKNIPISFYKTQSYPVQQHYKPISKLFIPEI